MKYLSFIRNIRATDREKYKDVSSREKLVVYTMKFLEDNNIPLSFNYICVATYKLFPERFHLGEFEEYPHIEMLNRTILHLRPQENNYAKGTAKIGYEITKLGYYIADQVSKELEGGFKKGKGSGIIIDQVKKMPSNTAMKYLNSSIYKKWKESLEITEDDFWNLFKTIPYSRIDYIKNEIKELKNFTKSKEDDEKASFVLCLEKKLKELL